MWYFTKTITQASVRGVLKYLIAVFIAILGIIAFYSIAHADPDAASSDATATVDMPMAADIELDLNAALDAQADPSFDLASTGALAGYRLLGTYTTYTTNVPNRNTNISLACKALNGTIVKPGRTFSFNSALGYTSAAKGYKKAGILVNGKPSTALGGGICQVSSTLYNAVLKAGLKVVERHPHSAPVGYVPKGRDATVSYGVADFKFKNNTSKNCRLAFSYNNRSLTVSVYGKK